MYVVSFTLQPLCSRRKNPDTHLKRGWLGPTAGLDVMVKKNIPALTEIIQAGFRHVSVCINKITLTQARTCKHQYSNEA
jgi:hypothetical protein